MPINIVIIIGRTQETEVGEFSLESTTFFNHPEYLDPSDGDAQNNDFCLIKFDQDIISMASRIKYIY